MPYIYCFYGRLWSNLLPAHGQRGSKSRWTQKEKMETHLYSFTRFLCLCSRELAMVLNYYAVCKKVCGKLGQSSSQEHSHSDCDTALMAALETSMWLNLTFNLQMALWTDRSLKYPCQDTMLTPCTWPPKWHWFPDHESSCSALVPTHFDHNQLLFISIPQCCSYVSIWRLK